MYTNPSIKMLTFLRVENCVCVCVCTYNYVFSIYLTDYCPYDEN